LRKALRAAVIGVGGMGKNHARVYSELPGVELVAVCDIEEELAQSIAQKLKVRAFSNYRELLKENLDAVSIAIPTSIHKKVAVDFANAGVNILVEKPIADTVPNAKELINSCQQNRVKLMIGHIERFNPVISTIKDAVKDEEIISIDIARLGPLPPRIKDVGILVDLAVHDIDIIRYITGSEFVRVYGMTSRVMSHNEDTAMISLKTASGVLCHISTNWLTPFKVREINIATKERFIKGWLKDKRLCEYRRWHVDNSYMVRELSIPQSEPLRLELEAFIYAITNDTEPPVTGEDGLKALEIAIRCLESRC